MSSKGSNNKRNTTTRNALIAIAVLLVIAVIVYFVQSGKPGTDKQDGTEPSNPGIIYDSNAVEGGWNEADLDTIVEGLNEKVEEGMISRPLYGVGTMNAARSFWSRIAL